jgi:hypothetical protein
MQYDRFKGAETVLIAKLAPYPHLEVEGGGMEAYSLRNWFRIRDRASGRRFTVLVILAADFLTARFDGLLRRFVRECGL